MKTKDAIRQYVKVNCLNPSPSNYSVRFPEPYGTRTFPFTAFSFEELVTKVIKYAKTTGGKYVMNHSNFKKYLVKQEEE